MRSHAPVGIASSVVTVLSLSTLLGMAACDGIFGPEAEYAAAHRAVDRWVERHPTGWTLDLGDGRRFTRPEWSRRCDQDPPSGFTVLRYAARTTEIDLFFRCPIDSGAQVEDLAAAFSHAVLQELPHGIASSGWRFRVLTPSSSIMEGVAFSAPAQGRLQVTVETPLYAVYGHSTRSGCQPPADAPSPEGCYLLREHPIPLVLTLTVPFEGDELG